MSTSKNINILTEELRNNSTATILFHQAIAAKLGINSTDHKCLDVIMKNQPLTAGQLATLTGLTTGAVTGVLDRLEKVGYIFREQDPEDKRRVNICMNQENAEKNIIPLFSSFAAEMNQLLSNYDDKELEFIIEFIRQCNRVLKKFTEKR
ncbi:DNA-binding MarR family transcriptional regulator [Paenibacillus rhizosphaerae]|uniref:DNA-binding MarR family transcriptional regulator n=1 Tax=Paenibacillus rhizosphaerae TaxID=297318 RepID=A0A839TU27_9BACL|nr:MarR family transcriptional regulator [Paenibacillus rhizosphaerae]MBB3128197.1 DNA-binding MarR family transcriptional regulator [Paenibacillus rhizosphaerae]